MIDIIRKLQTTTISNDTIITLIDELTKHLYYIAPREHYILAEKFAILFINFYTQLYDLTDVFINDQDFWLNSDFWKYIINNN
jgi:predicted transcriptional regulator